MLIIIIIVIMHNTHFFFVFCGLGGGEVDVRRRVE
jgi:hypothetical protein